MFSALPGETFGTAYAHMLRPSTAETKLFERRTRAYVANRFPCAVVHRGVDVRMKPVPTFPSPLQDAPS